MPIVFDAMQEALSARAGLAGVQVVSGPVGPQDTRPEAVLLIRALPSADEAHTEGNYSRSEDYTIDGIIWATKPGADELAIRDVRDRAFELLAEVEAYLRTDAGMQLSDQIAPSQITFCEMSRKGFDQGIHTSGGRWVQIDFGIRVQALLQRVG